jgi:hypothetical protein
MAERETEALDVSRFRGSLREFIGGILIPAFSPEEKENVVTFTENFSFEN